MDDAADNALFRALPAIRGRVPWVSLGQWPTPITKLEVGRNSSAAHPDAQPIWIKREDLSHPSYGGNKVRTLEVVLGRALAEGMQRVWASGAYGSNHALATAIHAPRVGLAAGAVLFPQPTSEPADANFAALQATGIPIERVSNIALLPFKMLAKRSRTDWPMQPGSASIEGSLGATSAALELAEQVARGECPSPKRIVVAVGSTCTVSGILAGVHLARALGIAFQGTDEVPHVVGVRVSPWPVTSHLRIALRARAVLRLINSHADYAAGVSLATLRSGLTIDGTALGKGYGYATQAGTETKRVFAEAGGPLLDLIYSAKAASVMLARPEPTPTLFWATKSAASGRT